MLASALESSKARDGSGMHRSESIEGETPPLELLFPYVKPGETRVTSITEDTTIAEALDLLNEKHWSSVPVLRKNPLAIGTGVIENKEDGGGGGDGGDGTSYEGNSIASLSRQSSLPQHPNYLRFVDRHDFVSMWVQTVQRVLEPLDTIQGDLFCLGKELIRVQMEDRANGTGIVNMANDKDKEKYTQRQLQQVLKGVSEGVRTRLEAIQVKLDAANEKRYDVSDISAFSNRNPWLSVDFADSLGDAVTLMRKYKARRAAITENEGEDVVLLLTATDIVHWAAAHPISSLINRDKTLEELGLGMNREVITVSERDSVWDALVLLQQHKISAVAVLDAYGCVCGRISVSDLVSTRFDLRDVSPMFVPIKMFWQWASTEHGRRVPPSHTLCVTSNNTLAETARFMSDHKNRRVFVTSLDNKPVGVISQMDLVSTQVCIQPEEASS